MSNYEALLQQHLRLRAAAKAGIEAANYPAGEGEARVYRCQLRDLERELEGEPQPHGWFTMSVS